MTEIRPFRMQDLGYFLPNEFSNPDPQLDKLTDPTFETQTLWCDGMVAAILCFQNYWGGNWHGFFLIAADFKKRSAVALRKHIRKTMIEKKALRLHTDSIACPTLDRWHRFLGFTLEGCRRKLLYGKDYHMWALLREEA